MSRRALRLGAAACFAVAAVIFAATATWWAVIVTGLIAAGLALTAAR